MCGLLGKTIFPSIPKAAFHCLQFFPFLLPSKNKLGLF